MTMTSSETKYSELVARYKRLREITRKLQNHALPKYLSRRALNVCGKRLGILRNDTLVLGHADEVCVFMDYCIYDYRQEGLNAVGRYMAESQLDPDSEEYAAVRAMSESFYSLVQVQDVLPGVGVRVNDLMVDREYLLIDVKFSQTAVKGVVLATRLLPFDDFVMTSGAALPADSKTLAEIFNVILSRHSSTDGESTAFDMEQRADLTAAIMRLCLENNMFSQIRYEDIDEDVGDEPVTSTIRRESRVGRNEPCPCGSGRKYKRCCGR